MGLLICLSYSNLTLLQSFRPPHYCRRAYPSHLLLHGQEGNSTGWAFVLNFSFFLFFLRFYLFIFREKGREGETSMCGCLLSAPYWGPGLHPRHVPWLGIKLVTLRFTSPRSIHWATPARANFSFLKNILLFLDRGREGERRGEEHWCAREILICCLSHTPNCGHGPQPRYVPWLGIEPFGL